MNYERPAKEEKVEKVSDGYTFYVPKNYYWTAPRAREFVQFVRFVEKTHRRKVWRVFINSDAFGEGVYNIVVVHQKTDEQMEARR